MGKVRSNFLFGGPSAATSVPLTQNARAGVRREYNDVEGVLPLQGVPVKRESQAEPETPASRRADAEGAHRLLEIAADAERRRCRRPVGVAETRFGPGVAVALGRPIRQPTAPCETTPMSCIWIEP